MLGRRSGGWQRERETNSEKDRETERKSSRRGHGGKNTERMREIRIYILVQRSMLSMRLVFNALINV